MTCDVIILAAGENARMQPMIPAHHKPLLWLEQEGRTVVAQCAMRASEARGKIIIVVAPSNAQAIVDVIEPLDLDVAYVVQPRAIGPHDAIARAITFVESHYVCVLMADNIIPEGLVSDVTRRGCAAVTVRKIRVDDAESFTWNDGNCWHDKMRCAAVDGEVIAWIGPLVLHKGVAEVSSWSWIDKFTFDKVRLHEGECDDIGTPARLTAALRKTYV